MDRMGDIRVSLISDGYSAEKVDQFIEYHTSNSKVWEEFQKLALDLIASGVAHYGAKAIQEVIRFHRAIRSDAGYKVNNNYSSFYARVFCLKYPEHKDFFETREVSSDA